VPPKEATQGGEAFKAEFSIRIWRLPKCSPPGAASWMSSFRVDTDFMKPHSSHILGKDDFDALAFCLAEANHFLAQLEKAGFELWFSDNPEYPFDSSASIVPFRGPSEAISG
jgi:hypothetical protein